MNGTEGQVSHQSSLRAWVHFGIACLLLAGSAVAFQYGAHAQQWAMQKESVPWPDGVAVDAETFRWSSLPTTLAGRYVLAADGELSGGQIDGIPDGEISVPSDVMTTLGIGTGWDKKRIADRKSNWHVIRIYRDTTRPARDPLRYWDLEVYYYTGALDTVPHVPERCLAASGATLLSSADITASAPLAVAPWDEPFRVHRAIFERSDEYSFDSKRILQYYFFSLNGQPESSWKKVRLTLANPLVRYCYFAKIQFSPKGHVSDTSEADRAAGEFLDSFLPIVSRAIPSRSDVKVLETSAGEPE